MNTTDTPTPEEPEKRRPGRTPLPDGERRDHGIRIRFSTQELSPLARMALAAGIPLATFIRDVATGKRTLSAHKIRRL